MPETETIQVLGRGTNVDFSIDDTVPFELAERRLREYLSECRGLYSSGTVTVNVGRRILAADQMAAIKGILGQETGLTVTRYWCPPNVLQNALAGPECRRALPSPATAVADEQIEDYVFSACRREADTPDARQDGAKPGLTCPTATGEAERPIGQQLSMVFPEPCGEKSAGSEMQLAGEDRPAPKSSGGEVAPVDVPEEVDVMPGDMGRNSDSADDDHEETKSSVAPATHSPGKEEEAGTEAAHSVFQSMLSRGSEALIIKNTCRSGEVVEYPGDVVVFGDVNPGAEIVAHGDIMVLGALRGMAHAGADGNLKATIFALNLESHRLQIGSCVGERPRGVRKGKGGGKPVNPQIAYLRRRSIFVAPFERRCEEYRGGVPYEG